MNLFHNKYFNKFKKNAYLKKIVKKAGFVKMNARWKKPIIKKSKTEI